MNLYCYCYLGIIILVFFIIIFKKPSQKMTSFTQKECESNNGMQTLIWGPMMWNSLHTISFNYPVNPTQDDKKNYTQYLLSHEHVLPCVYCRVNFKSNLKKAKFSQKDMKSRESFSRFVYRLHNCVNKMLGKSVDISYEEVRDRYEHFRARCDENKSKKSITDSQRKSKKEKGCTDALRGTKSKCVISIVPKTSRKKSFSISSKCKTMRKSIKK